MRGVRCRPCDLPLQSWSNSCPRDGVAFRLERDGAHAPHLAGALVYSPRLSRPGPRGAGGIITCSLTIQDVPDVLA